MLSRIVSSSLIIICLFGSLCLAHGAESKTISRVMILPFDTKAAGKFTPMAPGLQNMLISRLAAKDTVEIVDYALKKNQITKLKRSVKGGEASTVFTKLKTDYIVSGALFAVDNGLQIQVVFHPASKDNLAADLSIFAEKEDKIIVAMDQLSQKIFEKVFGYEAAKETAQIAEDQAGAEGFRTAHPDRAYKKGAYLGDPMDGGSKVILSKGIRKSLKIPVEMVAMAQGDLDGDGRDEIVVAGNGELRIFQFIQGVFKNTDSIPLAAMLKINAVNVADLNNDGKMEIYVSANHGYLAASIILEWSQEAGGTHLLEKIPYYIRPLDIPGEGMVLLGQNRGVQKESAIDPGIFRMVWSQDGTKLIAKEALSIPQSVNIFDFVLADLDNDGRSEKIVLGSSEKLLVYDHENRIKWVSSLDYGGSKNHFGPYLSDEDDSGLFNSLGSVESDDRVLTFIPTKIIVTDANGDGKNDIVIGSNKLTTYRFLENFRSYNGGYISCLTWNGEKMTELWRTNTVNGYIADYSFSVLSLDVSSEEKAGDSASSLKKFRNRLIIGQIPDRGVYDFLTFAGHESRLLAYEMDLLENNMVK